MVLLLHTKRDTAGNTRVCKNRTDYTENAKNRNTVAVPRHFCGLTFKVVAPVRARLGALPRCLHPYGFVICVVSCLGV